MLVAICSWGCPIVFAHARALEKYVFESTVGAEGGSSRQTHRDWKREREGVCSLRVCIGHSWTSELFSKNTASSTLECDIASLALT